MTRTRKKQPPRLPRVFDPAGKACVVLFPDSSEQAVREAWLTPYTVRFIELPEGTDICFENWEHGGNQGHGFIIGEILEDTERTLVVMPAEGNSAYSGPMRFVIVDGAERKRELLGRMDQLRVDILELRARMSGLG